MGQSCFEFRCKEGLNRRLLLLFGAIVVWVNGLLFVPQAQADSIGMVTGSTTGTYIQFGRDIAGVARYAGLEIEVKESEGSLDNIKRINSQENAAFGIVQADVLGFLLRRRKDPRAQWIARRLRLVFPLYNEEVHLFARKEIRRFEDLAGKRVVVGTKGSGNWLTSSNLLRMFKVEPAVRRELPPAEGVRAVLLGRADAMFYVVGKPAKLFRQVGVAQRDPQVVGRLRDVHFVPLNHEKMLQEYVSSTIGPDDYAWVDETVPTVAVKAVLVSYNFSSRISPYFSLRCDQLSKLGRVVRNNFEGLKENGHPKWKEVDLDAEIGIWPRDACSQPVGGRKPKTEEDLENVLLRILRGK